MGSPGYDAGFLAGWMDASLGIKYPIPVNNAYPEGWGYGYREGHASYGLGRRREDLGHVPDRRK